jgi:hypothetical protein
MMNATIAGLREALASYFGHAPARTALLRLREGGLLPAGRPGRDGSAEIEPRHAALALLALIGDSEPIDAAEAAQELGGYVATAYFFPPVGPCTRHEIADGVSLLSWLSTEIEEAAADPAYRVAGLWVEPRWSRVSTVDPDEALGFSRAPGAPPLLRLVNVARERLEFGPVERAERAHHDEAGRPLLAAMAWLVEPELIRSVASVFRMTVARTVLSLGGAA